MAKKKISIIIALIKIQNIKDIEIYAVHLNKIQTKFRLKNKVKRRVSIAFYLKLLELVFYIPK